MTARDRYHADALRYMTDAQREAITYLAGGDFENFSLDGVLPDGDLFIYTGHGRAYCAYYRVTKDGRAYENTEQQVSTPAFPDF